MFFLLSNIFGLVYNLTRNRLTNEQHWQIIEFYYQNACSVKKVHRALLPFFGQFNRSTEAAIRAIVTKFRTKFTFLYIKPPTRLRRVRTEQVLMMTLNYRFVAVRSNWASGFAPNLHYWTSNHQHAYAECELKKILQLYWPVLMMTLNYRFVAVRSNWAAMLLNSVDNFAEAFRSEAFENTTGARLEAERPTATQNFW